ncbi:cation:proton antiporter [Micromonospora matsumotoense]|uniref:cation:proton antiporter n=1 Tax=Micromonospora matsumotoense TaxID=121616 RepID=UPI001C40693D|nr:cation:proton antiporter [Micromonospora matsumotoense]
MAHAPVPLLPAPQLLLFLLQVAALLAVAFVLGRLASRLGMPAVVGELSAGLLLGPTLLDHLAPGLAAWLLPKQADQFHLLDAVGQIGVLLLVGVTGIEVDFLLLRRRGTTVLRVATAGLLLPLGLGVATGLLLPASLIPGGTDRVVFALFLGVAMCLSALPVIAKTLTDLRLLHRNIGQLILVTGMVDDAFGWLMLSIVAAMAATALHVGTIVVSVLTLLAIVLAAASVGRPLVRLALRLAERTGGSTGVVTVATIVMLACGAGTQALGMEAVFGAFVGGVLVGSSGGVARAALAPLNAIVLAFFAPLFFATAGLRVDLTALGRPVVLLTGLVVLTVAVVGKFAGAFVGGLASRLNKWESLALGAGMNARGVVEIVIAMVGLRLGVLSTETYTIVVLVAIVTSLMAPPILRVAMRRVEYTVEESFRARRSGASLAQRADSG